MVYNFGIDATSADEKLVEKYKNELLSDEYKI